MSFQDKTNSINCLPDNIIFEVLRYLPVKERCIAGRVCKQWRKIIASNSLWRHVDLLEYRLNLQRMWKILRAHFTSSLLSLRISGYAHSNYAKASVSDALLKDLQARCPNINTLQLHDCNTANLSLNCLPSTLTHLGITNSSWKPRWLKEGKDFLPNLTSLDLSSSVRVDNFDLSDISECSQIKSLSLSGCYRIKGSNIETVAKGLPLLESLNLSATGVDELGIHHVSRHCTKLKQLYLRRCPNIRDSWLAEIASGLKNLEVLDVSLCDNLSVDSLKTLYLLSNLKTLILCMKLFSDEEIESIRNGFHQKINVKLEKDNL